MGVVTDAVGSAISEVTGKLNDLLASPFRPVLKDFMKSTSDMYTSLVTSATDVLKQDPTTLNGGTLWSVVEPLNATLVAVGSSLVVLFFIIGLCQNSIDVKDNIRLETILKDLIKLCLTEYFVTNNLTVIKALFAVGTGIVNLMGCSTTFDTTISQAQLDAIDHYGLEILIYIILWLVVFLAVVGSGTMVLYMAYSRAIKILVLVPFGAIAFSTMAGSHQINHTVSAYVKFLLGTLLEAGVMIVALALCAKLLSSGGISAILMPAGSTQSFIKFATSFSLSALLTVSMVKGSQSVVQKGLAL